MTLAIGVKYPWGELNKLFTPATRPPNAIILASDSRWTYKSATVPHEDIGTKLFKISNSVGAVYAGSAKVGEQCIDELRLQLPKRKSPSYQLDPLLAQEVFQRVYKIYLASKKLSPNKCFLYILIGVCNQLGEAELYLFEYYDNFIAKPMNQPKGIGMSNAVKQFNTILNDELKNQVEEKLSMYRRLPKIPIANVLPMTIEPHHAAIYITASLNRIIESEFEKTVGGKVQCVVITAEGITLPMISYTQNPANDGLGFTRVTPRPNELKTLTGIFGCYDIMTCP